MIIDRGARIRVNNKSGEHVSGVKPLGTPLLHKINQVIVEKAILFPSRIESHNHQEEKYYHSGGVVLDERNNKTRRWKGGFQGRFHRDGQTQTSEAHHSGSSGLSKFQNIGGNDEEKHRWASRDRLE
jgi:hypothetical protein